MAEEDEDRAADEDTDAGSEEDTGSKKLDAKKIVLFVLLPLFLIGGIVAALFVTGTFDKMGGDKEKPKAEKKVKKAESDKPVFYEIPDMIVNLSGQGDQPRYLKLRVQLELKNGSDLEVVEQVSPRVVDHFQTYLRELRVQDLRGSAGIYRLRLELLERVNAAAYPVKVEDVLFQEIIIQ